MPYKVLSVLSFSAVQSRRMEKFPPLAPFATFILVFPCPPLSVSCHLQEGNTPLHYACLGENPEVISFLIRKASRSRQASVSELIEARNADMETPLLRAAVIGNVAVVRTLLVSA